MPIIHRGRNIGSILGVTSIYYMQKFTYKKGDYTIKFLNGKTAEVYCHTQTEARFLIERLMALKECNISMVYFTDDKETYSLV